MGRFRILIFAVALYLALIIDTEGQWQPPEAVPRPLCATQITLANYACSTLQSSTTLPPPTPRLPSTPSLSTNRESEGSSLSHTHRHRHEPEIPLTPMEASCCKWIQQLDNVCICGLLSQLPAFLARPQHDFSVSVGGSCHATFSCRGGVRT